jgi:hypothetical protein
MSLPTIYGYKAFYNGKTWDIHAESLYEAKLKAIKLICPPRSKERMVTVVLCEKDGQQVLTSTGSL